jgi:CDP-glucose 4,6-dehydratase
VALGARAVAHVVMSAIDPKFWRGRRVLLTGHTGFKGAWLSLWLQQLGAHVTGFSRGAPSEPSLYELARVGEGMDEIDGDVRDHRAVEQAVRSARPEVIVHMAAQSLVRRSFERPRETYEANVMGTVNVLDAVRALPDGVRVVVHVASDKCYENAEQQRAFGEQDELGGSDPYSSSKGAAEIVVSAYRRSFFSERGGVRLASARAGNVIGGGDWAPARLVPDVMRAALAGATVLVRNPNSTRPWQHVLNPLSGYLLLAHRLWERPEHAQAWNFGPDDDDARTVGWVLERIAELWPGELRWTLDEGPHPHEARYLRLDSSRAREQLGWRPPVTLDDGLRATVDWYRALLQEADMRAVTEAQIDALERPPARAGGR